MNPRQQALITRGQAEGRGEAFRRMTVAWLQQDEVEKVRAWAQALAYRARLNAGTRSDSFTNAFVFGFVDEWKRLKAAVADEATAVQS